MLDHLAEICGARYARRGGVGDAVAATTPRWVVSPGSPGVVADVLRLCADRGLTLVPRGSGSKLDWGATPPHVDILLDTVRLSGIWHHPPGSATVRVGAGTTLQAAQRAVGRTGWRLPFDPPSAAATVGGVVATAEAGPLSHRHGSPCRHLTGVDYVDAAGALVRAGSSGGGPDQLPELLCGSQGALAVLVSATVRLQPAPADRRWVCRSVATPLEVHDLVEELTGTGLQPAAIELDLPASDPPAGSGPAGPGRAAGSGPTVRSGPAVRSGTLAVLFEGEPGPTGSRADRAAALLGGTATVTDRPPSWWQRYPFGPGDVAIRLAVPTAHLHAAIYALRDAVGAPVGVRGSAGTGVVHAVLPGATPPERIAGLLTTVRTVLLARGGTCQVLAAPAAVRRSVDIWGDVPDLPRLRQLKQAFDPHRRLAPGRLPGGL